MRGHGDEAIAAVRCELEDFVAQVFASPPRAGQWTTGGLCGLMLEGWRKSVLPLGGRLGMDCEHLQQLVSFSPSTLE